jgi:hypothetical protein
MTLTIPPVLFLIFNRPDCTLKTFEAIRTAKPSQLFIAADGHRAGKAGEKELCEMARKVAKMVDWPCELQILFRETNLGCKEAVAGAITWFFSQVEGGIILEDDCVPDVSFFHFSANMLQRYRDDERIMMVCGTNFLYGAPDYHKYNFDDSYFFSNYYPIWGWATWKRAWDKYDISIKHWPDYRKKNKIYWLFPIKRIANHYKGMFDILFYKGFNTWDIQWWFACIFNHGLAIVPKHNLINNIGAEGTHTETQGQAFLQIPIIPIDYKNIKHPKYIYPENYFNKEIYRIVGVLKNPQQLLVAKIKLWLGIKI